MIKTIKDYDLNNQKVIIRVDFNVPIKDGVITDDNRLVESLETIKYAINNNAKVILLSHLGRIKTQDDLITNSLKPVAEHLAQLLHQEVKFIPFTKGTELENIINNMQPKEVVLLENTRFEDLDGEKESSNDPELGKYWASLGDIYINDAFGTSHRAHASNVGIASHLPSGIGFLVQKELAVFDKVLSNPNRPFTVILGGAKIKDKIGVIKNLVNLADYILIGGGMAYTFFKSQGFDIGSSILDETSLSFCQEILLNYRDKLILPVDIKCADDMIGTNIRVCDVNNITGNGLDIGPKTIELFKKYINESKTVIWNGPLGYFENDLFSVGTKAICEELSNLKATTIIGGGDSAAAAIKFGYKEKFTHISTGGGASLELLEGKVLPGIAAISHEEK